MVKGFTFNEIHSSTKYIKAIRTRRPLLPESKDEYIEIPFRNGSYLIPDNTQRDIFVEVDCAIEIPSDETFTGACWNIGGWLKTDTRKSLIFDDDPEWTYSAKVVGNIDIENIRYKNGQFTIVFRCLPTMEEVV